MYCCEGYVNNCDWIKSNDLCRAWVPGYERETTRHGGHEYEGNNTVHIIHHGIGKKAGWCRMILGSEPEETFEQTGTTKEKIV